MVHPEPHCFFTRRRFFATASRDKTLKIWDSATFTLLKVVDTIRDGGHINSVNRLLWLPECLVSASDDRSAILCVVCLGRCLGILGFVLW
ncbi:MAG: hypothetical protein IPL27_03820 [Lewinellaceae bacterium]|nr:hypothetical protein [Lewinellaceae bacterium]